MLKQHWAEMTAAGREWAVGAALTLLPLLAVVLRLLWFTHGDMQMFTTLLSSLNVGAVIASGIIGGVIPSAAIFAAVLYLQQPYLKMDNFYRESRAGRTLVGGGRRYYGLLLAIVIACLFSPLNTLVVFGISGVGVAMVYGVSDWFHRRRLRQAQDPESFKELIIKGLKPRARNLLAFTAVPASVAILLSIFTTLSLGFPVELVRVDGEPSINVGYVVSVEDVSLTLAYADGSVRRIDTDLIDERLICPAGSPAIAEVDPGATILQMILTRASGGIATPEACSQPSSSAQANS